MHFQLNGNGTVATRSQMATGCPSQMCRLSCHAASQVVTGSASRRNLHASPVAVRLCALAGEEAGAAQAVLKMRWLRVALGAYERPLPGAPQDRAQPNLPAGFEKRRNPHQRRGRNPLASCPLSCPQGRSRPASMTPRPVPKRKCVAIALGTSATPNTTPWPATKHPGHLLGLGQRCGFSFCSPYACCARGRGRSPGALHIPCPRACQA